MFFHEALRLFFSLVKHMKKRTAVKLHNMVESIELRYTVALWTFTWKQNGY